MSVKLYSFAKEKIKTDFLVPDYYKDFVCKGKECRDSCCMDWKVNIPMDQYFLLHGLSCNPKLKEKIDRTFRPLVKPTNERYAEIVHNHNGDCPMHKKDGYCLLHEQCGEEVLPWVCRYYPRGPRFDYAFECSCANSCEKTLELLFSNDNKISFEKRNLTFFMRNKEKELSEAERNRYQNVRKACFDILTNREISLTNRILQLGVYLKDQDNTLNPNAMSKTFELKANIEENYQILESVLSRFNGKYPRLLSLINQVQNVYKDGDYLDKYNKALNSFNNAFPNHEIMFEKMLINDLFFKKFPFNPYSGFYNQYMTVCGTYILIRYLTINLIESHQSKEALIDLLSRIFTVISHSEFDNNLVQHLQNAGIYKLDQIEILIKL